MVGFFQKEKACPKLLWHTHKDAEEREEKITFLKAP